MTEPIALWHGEHLNFARLLDLLELQVAAFHDGGEPNYELMSDIVYYMSHYSDRFHHPREDVAFARLLKYEPSMQKIISQLTQEHRVIAAAGEELLRRLDEANDGMVTPRAHLEVAAATYLVYYRQHIYTEEREVLPRAAQILNDEDWSAVAGAVANHPDPLFGRDVEERFRALHRHIADEAALSSAA